MVGVAETTLDSSVSWMEKALSNLEMSWGISSDLRSWRLLRVSSTRTF